MTLFEALPDDITKALFSYCKDDECLNDATLRALRTELKLDKAEHNKYSHDCLRCDKFKNSIAELENLMNNKLAKAKELLKCALVHLDVLADNSESPDYIIDLIFEIKEFLKELKYD